MFCARSRPKKRTKTYNKELCRGSGFRRIHFPKKHEWEAFVSPPNVYCVNVFEIKSVGTNAFSYFLFLLFCARKLINFKTFGGWEKLGCLADHRRGDKSKWARNDPALFQPSRASRPQSFRTSRARRSLFPPLRLGKSEKRPVPKRKQLKQCL